MPAYKIGSRTDGLGEDEEFGAGLSQPLHACPNGPSGPPMFSPRISLSIQLDSTLRFLPWSPDPEWRRGLALQQRDIERVLFVPDEL